MQKIIKPALLLFLLLWQFNAFSQFSDLPIQNQKDYNMLIKKIQRKYRCSKWFSKKDTRLIPIFELRAIVPISKEEFSESTFLNKLEYVYAHSYKFKFKDRDFILPQKPIPFGNIRIFSKEKVLAIFPYQYMKFVEFKKFDKKYYEKILKEPFYENKSYEEYREIRKTLPGNSSAYFPKLLNYIWDKGNLFIFQIKHSYYDTYFLINKQLEIFVFFCESDGCYNVLPIKEFIDNHWKRFSEEEGKWITR